MNEFLMYLASMNFSLAEAESRGMGLSKSSEMTCSSFPFDLAFPLQRSF